MIRKKVLFYNGQKCSYCYSYISEEKSFDNDYSENLNYSFQNKIEKFKVNLQICYWTYKQPNNQVSCNVDIV